MFRNTLKFKNILFTSSLFFIFLFFIILVLPINVNAGVSDSVSGSAWSDNIGWISFNNISDGSLIDYGVSVSSNGTFSGEAWSDNIGWIDFGATSCGSAGQLNTTTGIVTGWAKAVAGGTSQSGGWDGCISLKGTSPSYGVTYNAVNKKLIGSAWGSDVVGWVSFTDVNINFDLPTVDLKVDGADSKIFSDSTGG